MPTLRVYRTAAATPASSPKVRVYRESASGSLPSSTVKVRVFRESASGGVSTQVPKVRVFREFASGSGAVTLAPLTSFSSEPFVTTTLTARPASGSATPTSYTWRVVSGPAITFSQSGDSIIFETPAVMGGGVLVLGVVGRSGTSTSQERQVTVTVYPHLFWNPTSSGSYAPFRPPLVLQAGAVVPNPKVRVYRESFTGSVQTTTPPTNPPASGGALTADSGDLANVLNVSLDTSGANVKLPSKSQVVVTLSSKTATSYQNLLVDVEASQNGTKVSQAYQQNVVAAAGSNTAVTFVLDGLSAGSFTVKVLVFDQPATQGGVWGSKRWGQENAATITVTPADPYTPNPSNPTGFFRAPQQVNQYVASYPSLQVIADQPQGTWYGNEWVPNPQTSASALASQAAGARVLLVVYSIPYRDSGNYSAGGLPGGDGYKAWIDQLAQGFGTAPVTYILEPDALGLLPNLDSSKQQERLDLMKYAVAKLKSNPNAKVYVDASMWVSVPDMANRLNGVNPGGATAMDGFSINVSGYLSTAKVQAYGNALSSQLGGMHWVTDTSRNGVGANDGDWCNPSNQGLGKKPTLSPGSGFTNCDALFWIKAPGESDGQCNGGPAAGVFWVDKALDLVARAVF